MAWVAGATADMPFAIRFLNVAETSRASNSNNTGCWHRARLEMNLPAPTHGNHQ